MNIADKLLKVGIFTDLMHRHKTRCYLHGPEYNQPGVAGIDVDGEQFLCAWCDAKDPWKMGWPVTTINEQQLEPWVCKTMLQGAEFLRNHMRCAPDPARAKTARLIKKSTDDGVNFVCDHIDIGAEYRIHPHTIKDMQWGVTENPGVWVTRKSVWVEHSAHGGNIQPGGWMPLEMFEIEKETVQ